MRRSRKASPPRGPGRSIVTGPQHTDQLACIIAAACISGAGIENYFACIVGVLLDRQGADGKRIVLVSDRCPGR